MVLEFTVRNSAGDVIRRLRSDQGLGVQTQRLADGWELSWEDGGGPPADLTMVIRPRTTTTPTYKTVTSPDYKIVRYIKDFSVNQCQVSMIKSYIAPGPACAVLDMTANPVPPANAAVSMEAWHAFWNSKEYRSIVHLPPYTATCDVSTGTVVGAAGVPEGTFGVTPMRSMGYTPPVNNAAKRVGFGYLEGEEYLGAGGVWSRPAPDVTMSEDKKSVHLTYRVAVRAPTTESAFAPIVSTGRSLPFVWTLIEQDLRCDGKAPTAVTFSQIPSLVVYKDGAQVASVDQSNEWGPFTVSGGFGHFTPGYGNLYGRCSAVYFDTVPAKAPACGEKISYGGGSFGSGWLHLAP